MKAKEWIDTNHETLDCIHGYGDGDGYGDGSGDGAGDGDCTGDGSGITR